MILNRFARKINNFLFIFWNIFLPVVIAFIILLMNYDLYVLLNDELVAMWFPVITVLSIIYFSGWAINLIWGFIAWIVEKVHFYRLAKYYKEHPEEELKNMERLAKDFEEIARIIREKNNKND